MVNYKKDDKNVTLSLRQADILRALAHDDELCKVGGCVPALQNVKQVFYMYDAPDILIP